MVRPIAANYQILLKRIKIKHFKSLKFLDEIVCYKIKFVITITKTVSFLLSFTYQPMLYQYHSKLFFALCAHY